MTPEPQANTLDEIIQLLDNYHEGGEFHDYTPLEKQRHAKHFLALITEARIEAREDSYSECFRIIKEVNDKLFMYEIVMGKIDYDYNGTDTVEKFKQYQELEPERVKFGAWLEAQEKQLKENK